MIGKVLNNIYKYINKAKDAKMILSDLMGFLGIEFIKIMINDKCFKKILPK